MTFALQLGYKKIILCGVDLNSNQYFYDISSESYESHGLVLPPPFLQADFDGVDFIPVEITKVFHLGIHYNGN